MVFLLILCMIWVVFVSFSLYFGESLELRGLVFIVGCWVGGWEEVAGGRWWFCLIEVVIFVGSVALGWLRLGGLWVARYGLVGVRGVRCRIVVWVFSFGFRGWSFFFRLVVVVVVCSF